MNRAVLFFLVLLFAGTVSGQTANQSVKVFKDPRIDLLVKKQVESNEILTRDERSFVAGYRILVINTVDRAQANQAKIKMYQAFPELKSYLTFQSPKFHLKVGNFRDREEAEDGARKGHDQPSRHAHSVAGVPIRVQRTLCRPVRR